MKHLGFFLVAIIIATSACSKAGDPEEGSVTIEKGRLAFILPDAGRAVTYAAGEGAENGADNDVLGIYMFGADDKFISLTTRTYSDGESVSEGRKFTVSVTGSGERRFVFVKAPASHSLPSITAGELIGVLASAVTQAYTISSPLAAPFVMSNALASDQPYVKVTDIESQTNEITVSLKRRVARFDVVADGIDITNVSISNAAPTGKVLDHADNVLAPGVGGLTYTIAGGSLANGKSFYLYPTTLGAGSTGTVITVTAENKTYFITLATSQPIDANKLYRIIVTQSATSSNLSFKLVVADWTDADNLPTFEEGSVELGFNSVVSSSQGVSTSTNSESYSIVDYSEATAPASAQLYYVSATEAKPQAEIEALHGTHAEAIDVSISNPVQVSYAGTPGYMSTVTISLPKTTVPVDLKVRLTGTTGDKDSVSIISVPAYYDERYLTDQPYKPVLKAGRYWAPVNVGATSMEAVTAAVPTDAQTGLYIQWGRTTGFYRDAYVAETDTLRGPVTADNPSKKVILSNTGDWLTTAFRNDLLWSGENVQGPCPDGWKVPSQEELLALIAVYGTKTTPAASDRRWTTTGDNGNDVLYFVPGGYYGLNSTTVLPGHTNTLNNAAVWVSDINGTMGAFWYLANNGNRADKANRSWGLPVRCIQR
ncbi:MAG: FimB/Mfa2 family fimbrial subunit [Tannerellaceae bacterium]|nr:FimB/Mfa2 family fimbrial subunit [Tannerellaceae bacterium]